MPQTLRLPPSSQRGVQLLDGLHVIVASQKHRRSLVNALGNLLQGLAAEVKPGERKGTSSNVVHKKTKRQLRRPCMAVMCSLTPLKKRACLLLGTHAASFKTEAAEKTMGDIWQQGQVLLQWRVRASARLLDSLEGLVIT